MERTTGAPGFIATDAQPDITRTDTGAVFSSEWLVGSADRQRTAAEAVVAGWREGPWAPGLLAYTILLSTDGESIRHYTQWTDAEALTSYQRTVRDDRISRLDRQVPGIVRRGLRRYRLHRSVVAPDAGRVPGLVVVPTAEADEADALHRFVDAVAGGSGLGGALTPGLLAAHFHLSTDGAHMLNYALWTSEADYDAALGGKGTLADPALTAGLRNPGATRYRLFTTLTPPT